jgi:hypothetical protein
MLIAVNGEADMGKDYVADWCAREFDLVKIAFADPMKRFVRQFFGISAENLWGPSSKRNEELDAEPLWKFAFSQLHTMHQFTVKVVPEEKGPELRAKAFSALQQWVTKLRKDYPEKISARIILQTLGTEWGRAVDPMMWINYLVTTQSPLLAQGYPYTPELGVRLNVEPETPKRGIIVPDLRFANELEWAKAERIYVVRVRRLSRVRTDGSNVGLTGHQSEQEQRGIPDSAFDKVFEFPEGLDKVDVMLADWADSEMRKAA